MRKRRFFLIKRLVYNNSAYVGGCLLVILSENDELRRKKSSGGVSFFIPDRVKSDYSLPCRGYLRDFFLYEDTLSPTWRIKVLLSALAST